MSSSSAPPHRYSPLIKDDEIRLLELEAGAGDAEIYCTLKHVARSERPSYEALSYEWGPPVDTKAINVNGTRKEIRENLWSALQHLRLEKSSRFLWVDALSIHQDDTLERNHQVNQMGAIYSQADRVIAWLGLPNSSSKTAFGLIELAKGWKNISLEMAFRLGRSHLNYNMPTRQDLDDFRTFCTRTYWQRLWIVQEILLAEDIIIQCGKAWSEWSHFRNAFALLHRVAMASGPTGEPATTVRAISKTIPSKLCEEWLIFGGKRLGTNELPRSWVETMRHYGGCRCQDIRDRMLALRALAPACCQEAVRADYTLSVAALCAALLSHQLSHHSSSGLYEVIENLGLLGLNGRFYLQEGMTPIEVIERLEHMARQDMTEDVQGLLETDFSWE